MEYQFYCNAVNVENPFTDEEETSSNVILKMEAKNTID